MQEISSVRDRIIKLKIKSKKMFEWPGKKGVEKSKKETKEEKPKEELKETSEGISRRDFLKKGLEATIALGTGFLFPKEVWAGLKEIQEREGKIEKGTFKELVFDLFRKVYSEKNEQVKYFLRANKDFETGIFFSDKTNEGNYEPKESFGNSEQVVVPYLAIKVFLENPYDIEELDIFHTHPQTSLDKVYAVLPAEIVNSLDKTVTRSLPFSGQDVFSFLLKGTTYPEAIEKYSEVVVEPTGFWKMKLDSQNEEIKKIIVNRQNGIKKFRKADLKFKESFKNEILLKAGKILNRKLSSEEIPDELISPWIINSKMEELVEFFNQKQLEIFIECPLEKVDRLKKIQEFINEAREKGIILEYQELKFKEKD